MRVFFCAVFVRIFFLFLAFALLPEIAFAYTTQIGEVGSFGEFISGVWEWASQLIFGISVIVIIIGGVVLMFAGGNEGAVANARSMIFGSLVASLLVVFSAVLQKVLHKPTENIGPEAQLSDTAEVIQGTTYILLGIIGSLAVLALIYNGFRLTSSGGDAERTESAKRGLKFAIIGLLVAFSAFVILRTVLSPF